MWLSEGVLAVTGHNGELFESRVVAAFVQTYQQTLHTFRPDGMMGQWALPEWALLNAREEHTVEGLSVFSGLLIFERVHAHCLIRCIPSATVSVMSLI